MRCSGGMVLVVLAVARCAAEGPETRIVSASDTRPEMQRSSQFVADGTFDAQVIEEAIDSLPPQGGIVRLLAGNYWLRNNSSRKKGRIVISRSNITLAGEGRATRLHLAGSDEGNLIFVTGDDTSNVTIRDLSLNGHRDANAKSSTFDNSLIKARSSGDDTPVSNIRVDAIFATDCPSICVMLWGSNVSLTNSAFGDATSDIAEILGGPGVIANNTADVRGVTGHGFGTDAANDVVIDGNKITVHAGAEISQVAYRFWQAGYRNQFTNNELKVHSGGRVASAVEMRGYRNYAKDNFLFNPIEAPRMAVVFNGDSLITNNQFQNSEISVRNTSNFPAVFIGNALISSSWGSVSAGTLIFP